MKKVFFLTILLFRLTIAFTQSVGVGTLSPDASAQLDISSSTKGLLVPRMTTTNINTINNPAKGLLVYDSNLNQLMINSGTKQSPNWQQVINKGWTMTGNSGTDATIHFIGTTDNTPLLFRVNNRPSGIIDSVSQSTYIGYRSGGLAPNLAGNVAIGYKAAFSNTSGKYNSVVGTNALAANTTGSNNVVMGHYALYQNTTGEHNTAIGSSALVSNTTGYTNVAIGSLAAALNTIGRDNTAIGHSSLYSNTSGGANVAIGVYALRNNTNGWYSTALGASALYYNTSGTYNSAVGGLALHLNTTGSYNVASGYASLYNNANGSYNSAYGNYALNENVSGSYNTALGGIALELNSSGSGNTAIGYQALDLSTSANNNTAVGFKAGRGFGHGWNNTFIGAETNLIGSGGYNAIAIGNGAVALASSQARIGNSSTYSIGGFANWSNISDGRYKTNIREDVSGLAFIMKLRPVTYQLDISSLSKKLGERMSPGSDSVMKIAMHEKEKMIQSGFIAQEVERSATELGYDFSGIDKPKNENDLYGLRYAEFVVPLVKGMQEQQQTIQSLQAQVEELKKIVNQLLARPK